jgi:hypothetical protein
MPSAELLSHHYQLVHQKQLLHSSRRMSSSAVSNPDTESSINDTRSLTPVESDKRDSVDRATWDVTHSSSHSPSADRFPNDDHKVQLPSISTTFEDSHLHDSRRSSLPVLHSESRLRHNPYPTTNLRQSYTPSGQSSSSSLSSYTFPSATASPRASARPRVTTDLGNFNGNGSHVNGSYDSPYPNSGLSIDATSYFFVSEKNSDFPNARFISLFRVRKLELVRLYNY